MSHASKRSAAIRRILLLLLGYGSCIAACTVRPPPAREASPPAIARPSEAEVAEMGRLRTAYGDREDFGAVCERDRPLEAWAASMAARRWDEVLSSAEPWLAHCPVDIDGHVVAGAALREVGRTEESERHLRTYAALVASVLASGDGRSPTTAFVVISVPEEYATLRALGLESRGQALVDGAIDEMTVQGPKGPGKVYFDPAAHFRRLARELGGL